MDNIMKYVRNRGPANANSASPGMAYSNLDDTVSVNTLGVASSASNLDLSASASSNNNSNQQNSDESKAKTNIMYYGTINYVRRKKCFFFVFN
jgi:hypothetical protein